MLPALKAKLTGRASEVLADIEARIDLCADLRSKLETMLADDCPLTTRDGGFIRAGAHAKLDELRELMSGGKQWMASYQAAEIERTGIPCMKVGFNKVFGYYLEVTHAHRDKVPDGLHPQADAQERRTVHHAGTQGARRESADRRRAGAATWSYELFVELRELGGQAATPRLQATAAALADVDVLAAWPKLAPRAELRAAGDGRRTSARDRRGPAPGGRRDRAGGHVCAERLQV